jgi:hypothetical protein
MHSAVLVIVPDGVADIEGYVRTLLEPHRRSPTGFRRFDYFVIGGLYDGQILVPEAPRRRPCTVENNICAVDRFDRSIPCDALLLPEGTWESVEDYDDDGRRTALDRWRDRVELLLAEHPKASVVAVDAHS